MGRPRKEEITEATTDRILDAAQNHFSVKGFEGARLQDIAKDAGITRPSLLYHFPAKEVLYEAVVDRSFSQLLQAFEGLEVDGTTIPEIVDGVVVAYLRFLETHPHISGIVIRELLGKGGRGKEVVIERLVPVLDWLEALHISIGKEVMPVDFPIRAAVLQLGSDAMFQSATGELRDQLWGKETRTRELAQIIFSVREPVG